MDIKINIWANEDDEPIPEEIQRYLNRQGLNRANEMFQEGYTSGELFEEYEGKEYSGWFEITNIHN